MRAIQSRASQSKYVQQGVRFGCAHGDKESDKLLSVTLEWSAMADSWAWMALIGLRIAEDKLCSKIEKIKIGCKRAAGPETWGEFASINSGRSHSPAFLAAIFLSLFCLAQKRCSSREKLTSRSQEQRLIAMRDYSTAVVQNAQQQIDGENRSED
ncbi:hypothetical protein BJX66DRAFT_213992 [Aspergillus keveii]|uniref:Uncharacterized protein n=1 Tax=Aspergillus keveii TaxID=714993 RepID=A0ABR4GM47_9EURO